MLNPAVAFGSRGFRNLLEHVCCPRVLAESSCDTCKLEQQRELPIIVARQEGARSFAAREELQVEARSIVALWRGW